MNQGSNSSITAWWNFPPLRRRDYDGRLEQFVDASGAELPPQYTLGRTVAYSADQAKRLLVMMELDAKEDGRTVESFMSHNGTVMTYVWGDPK